MIKDGAGVVRNDDWIEDADKADPSPLPRVPGFDILIRPISVRTKSKGGLLLPDQMVDDIKYLTTVGRVLAVGDMAFKSKDYPEFKDCAVKPGDYVAYGRFDGQRFVYKGVKVLLLKDTAIRLVLEKPEDVDPASDIINGVR